MNVVKGTGNKKLKLSTGCGKINERGCAAFVADSQITSKEKNVFLKIQNNSGSVCNSVFKYLINQKQHNEKEHPDLSFASHYSIVLSM